MKDREPRISPEAAAVVKAIDRLSENVGKWLAAVAMAAANPNDNSEQVQKEIDKIVAQLNAGTSDLGDAINEQQKGAKQDAN